MRAQRLLKVYSHAVVYRLGLSMHLTSNPTPANQNISYVCLVVIKWTQVSVGRRSSTIQRQKASSSCNLSFHHERSCIQAMAKCTMAKCDSCSFLQFRAFCFCSFVSFLQKLQKQSSMTIAIRSTDRWHVGICLKGCVSECCRETQSRLMQ